MVDFRIDVVVDPKPAVAGVKQVNRGLDSVEKNAADLGRELTKAFTLRDAGLSSTLQKLNATLAQASDNAKDVKGDLARIGAEDPFAKQLASIRAQSEQLNVRNRVQGAEAQLIQTSLQLQAQKRTLTKAETDELRKAVAQQEELKNIGQQRAAVNQSILASETRVRDAQIRALKVSRARRAALLEANRLRGQGINITKRQVIELQRQFAAERRITSELNKHNVAQQKVTGSTSRFASIARTAFAGIGIALLTRQLIGLSDAYTEITNKLKTVNETTGDVSGTFDTLANIAVDTRSDLAALTQVFQRGSLAAKELGASEAELLIFTEKIGKGLAVQGTSANAARGALQQLSQALGSGIVRGEEFNSILEGALPIAQAAARGIDGFGGSVSKLRTAVIKGQITSKQFFEGILAGSDQIDKQFATTVPTIGQAFTVLNTKLIQAVGGFNEATGAAEGFSGFIITIAKNLGVMTDAVIALSTVLLLRYAQRAIPAAIAGTKALTLATIASTAAIAAAAAGLFLLNKRLRERAENEKEIGRVLGQTMEDSEAINSTAAQLTATQRELNKINRLVTVGVVGLNGEILKQNKLSESQAARVKVLEERLRNLRGELVVVSKEQIAANKAQIAAKKVEDDRATALKRQEDLLKALKQPELDRKERIKDLQVLIARGGEDVKLLAAELEKLQQKQEKATTVKADRPTSTFADELAALDKQNVALAIRTMKQNEFTAAQLAELQIRDKIKRDITDPERAALIERFEKQLQINEAAKERQAIEQVFNDLRQEGAELEILLSGKSEDRMNAELTALALKQRGIELTEEQIAALERENGKVREGNEELAKRTRLAGLKEELDVGAQIKQQREDLLALRAQEAELIPEVDRALEDLRLRELEASNELSAGFERAFIKIKREAEDLAAVGEDIVNVFANRATEAITEFARTGQFSFKEFANAILEDILKIIIRLLVVQAIQAATGLGGAVSGAAGAAGSAATNSGAQFGGTVQPGQAPRPVGENGPELFVPNRTGTIVPNPADVQQPPPQVNVQLVTVENPDMVAEAISSGDADEAIIQRIGANRDRVDAAQG